MKLSIIIPVYNAEQYLKNSLQSVFEQDLPLDDYEIIIINDGSVDNSKQILQNFQMNYSNIVYLEQSNQGVSVARNKGIDRARGTYIFFMDSDDKLSSNCLRALCDKALLDDLDILFLNIAVFNEKGEFSHHYPKELKEDLVYKGINCPNRGFVFNFYKKQIISTIRFVPDVVIAEDSLFNAMVHYQANRCGFLDIPAYNYIFAKESASRSNLRYSERGFQSYVKALSFFNSFVENNLKQKTEQETKFVDLFFLKTVSSIIKYNILPSMSVKRLKVLKKELKKNNLDYLREEISNLYLFFNFHWIIFFMSYFFMKVSISIQYKFSHLLKN